MQIRYLTTRDVAAAKLVADENRDALGFLPRKKLEEAAEQKRCFIATADEHLVGFVIFRHRKIDNQTTLSDICVDTSSRRCGVGSKLIRHLITDCEEKGRDFILLKCPENLEANHFYEHIGFELQNIEQGKSRKLKVWCMPIPKKVEI
jgi:ribosomal protein S18 acetylase RimI-like enzyme